MFSKPSAEALRCQHVPAVTLGSDMQFPRAMPRVAQPGATRSPDGRNLASSAMIFLVSLEGQSSVTALQGAAAVLNLQDFETDPVVGEGLLQSLVFSAVFSPADLPHSPQVPPEAAPAAIRVKRCSFNPGASFVPAEIVLDQSSPGEGQGGCATWSTGQCVLEEVIHKIKKKKVKAASSTELTPNNNMMQVFSNVAIAIIQAKSQLSPYGAFI